jgi:hypothetical protein
MSFEFVVKIHKQEKKYELFAELFKRIDLLLLIILLLL